MSVGFRWTTFDVTSRLPENWRHDVGVVAAEADFREFPRTPLLSHEAEHVARISRGRVHADRVRLSLPWLYRFYRGCFQRTRAS